MRILVACEFSGVVREAFKLCGHDAWSCDLLPSEQPGQHYQCDIFEVLGNNWDLVIAHPPCTYLAVSGNRWYHGSPLRLEAIHFVEKLWDYPIKHLALENPVGVLSTQSKLGKPTQYIQPYEYGHEETKKTCLWLRGLPLLKPTHIMEKREQKVWKMAPSQNRSKERSRTYKGWAEAMAEQWGNIQ